MRRLLLGCACLACAGAMAQGVGMGGYSSMSIEEAGQIVGGFDGTIEEMTGGVHIVLRSDDPTADALPIRAETITFDWPEGASQPRRIVLAGGVRITHPEADISAGRADWNFEAGTLVFTGNPVMNSDTVQGMTGDRVTLFMEDGTYKVENPKIPGLQLGRPENSDLLVERDIADWPGFVDVLKAAWEAEAASPGKHILSLFPADGRGLLLSTPTDVIVDNKGQLLEGLNSAMKTPEFYNEEAWAGVPLPEAATTLRADGAPQGDALVRFNRLAFDAAFAGYQGR